MVKTVKTLKAVKKKDENRAVGRRKAASARVKIDKGEGKITVNGKDYKEYFSFFEQGIVIAPLKTLSKEKDLDINAKVSGGGKKGQAVAVSHGIARALVKWNEEFKKTLKVSGLLTRDARIKERKKPGLKKARRAPQWSKR
jgi:small subunit ribosomal protein S9